MRTIFCLFDSLNRTALGCYGGDEIPTPNFDRFSKRAITYDNHFVGSLPCMPARRDLHTGRLNFMHRSWGPLEPFDNSYPELLKNSGVYSHLVTDHNHYFEDGGLTYHTRFSSFDFIRGQENDAWKAMVQPPMERFREKMDEGLYDLTGDGRVNDPERGRIQFAINKEFMKDEQDMPGPKCFKSGLEFLDANRNEDDWLLHLECFDPHEPFDAPKRFKDQFPTDWDGKILNWPRYGEVNNTEAEIAEIRANYKALVAMCDAYFGKLLDYMDKHDMWKDTALVLTTDHGLLLSEHDWWGKNLQPYYREISHIPLIIHDPRNPETAGSRISQITQTIDLMPTLLDLHDTAVPEEVRGKTVLNHVGAAQTEDHEYALFAMFGGPMGITDGNYDFYLYPPDIQAEGLHEYTLMPTLIRSRMTPKELKTAELDRSFEFTKGAPVLKINAMTDSRRIPCVDNNYIRNVGTRLYHTAHDPSQENPIRDFDVEHRMLNAILRILADHECPPDFYEWFGINQVASTGELAVNN